MSVNIGVIGAGISGLATAYILGERLSNENIEHSLTIYEKGRQPGGSVRSERVDDFLIEWGPNGFLNNEPATMRLVDALGLRSRINKSRDAARKRFIKIGGRLRQVPTHPHGFLTSDIIPFTAKMRFALEPFIGRRKSEGDESVADFVRRRFGKRALTRMFDPLVSGVYAGDVEKLSINNTLSVFAEMEGEYGSVVKGMIKRVRQRRRQEKDQDPATKDELLTNSKNPMAGTLLSFVGGMGELTASLAEKLGSVLKSETSVNRIESQNNGYSLLIEHKGAEQEVEHDIVIITAPPVAAAQMVNEMDAELADTLGRIPSSSIAVVALGYEAEDLGSELDGFGYLIPRAEGVRPLGVLWSSSIFEHRANADQRLLTVMIGGAHDPEAVTLSDEELTDLAVREIDSTVGINGKPAMRRIVRHQNGIPQYVIGHRERLSIIDKRMKDLRQLYLAGNGYHGISTNDCIKHSYELVEKIVSELKSGSPQ